MNNEFWAKLREEDKKESFEFWCIRYPDGEFLAIDQSTGGYPMKTTFLKLNMFKFQ